MVMGFVSVVLVPTRHAEKRMGFLDRVITTFTIMFPWVGIGVYFREGELSEWTLEKAAICASVTFAGVLLFSFVSGIIFSFPLSRKGMEAKK